MEYILVIPAEKPRINVNVSDNVIRIPAGSDYAVRCSSNGFPAPKVFWVDKDEKASTNFPLFFPLVLDMFENRYRKGLECRKLNDERMRRKKPYKFPVTFSLLEKNRFFYFL